MKKNFLLTLVFCSILFPLLSKAQSWTPPVIIEAVEGVGADVGKHSSLVVVNGKPAIAYYDETRGNLVYKRALDADGTIWADVMVLDSEYDVGQYASMKIVNGKPAIAYFKATFSELKYIRANDVDGTSWGEPITVEDNIGQVGKYANLVIVNGNPAIAFYNSTTGDLVYNRSNDMNGDSWSTTATVTSTGSVGTYISMEVINGNPAIAYYDATNVALRYIRSTDVNGIAWGTPLALDVTGGTYSTLTTVNGNPAIAYYSSTDNDLKYIRASDADGSAWNTPVIIDANGGTYNTLAVINGVPTIAYYKVTGTELRYISANNANGTTWSTAILVDAQSAVGTYNKMAIVNGNPAISYYDQTNTNLKYVRATNASGTAWNTPVSFDMGAVTGQYTTQAVVGGFPAVAYYDAVNFKLKYVRANDALGTTWGPSVQVGNTTNHAGEYASMAVVNGRPAISYYDNTANSLRYVRANDANGTSWPNSSVIDLGGDLGQYTSLAIINGKPAIAYYDVTNSSLKYINSNDIDGTSWQTGTTVHNLGDVGKYASLKSVNGYPAICYYGTSNTNLFYVVANDVAGDTWGTPIVVDDVGSVGTFCNMEMIDGNPAISYCSAGVTASDLKYIRATDPYGATWGTSIVLESDIYGHYNSLAVIDGYPAISYLDNLGKNLNYIRANDAEGNSWGPIQVLAEQGDVGMYSQLLEINNGAGICYIDETEKWPMYISGSTTCMPLFTQLQPFGCTSYTSPSGLYTYTNDGIYYDTLTSVNGCDSIIIMDVAIGVNYSSQGFGEGATIILPGATFQWLDCNNAYAVIPGATGDTFYAQLDGDYACAINYQGCTDTTGCFPFFVINVGLNEAKNNSFNLYPNPNDGLFAIDSAENSEMIITDALGKSVRIEQLNAGKNEFNFSNEPQGIYFVKLRNSKSQQVLKMIVNK